MRPVTATYRIQFGGETTFARAGELAPYLAGLGISHLYASPVFAAGPGSTHGYDVTDYNALNPELGGRDAFEAMVRALNEHGVGVILDIVPNHMAAHPKNPWFASVLREGRASEHADTFDIDWDKAEGRIVLPILGAPLEEVLKNGELSVVDDDDFGRALAYYDARFPLAEGSEKGDIAETVAAQAYELSFWRELEKLNYRRFFDITDLIGVRMEDEAVFERSHRLIRELVEAGLVDGLRVDHVDGMRDPQGYLERLAGLFPDVSVPPVWVEKIVESEERLPESWPVRGETGYAVMPWLDGVMVDTGAEGPLTHLYAELCSDERVFDEVVAEAKRQVMEGPFAHEFGALAAIIAKAETLDRDAVLRALEDIAGSFPVYRTYLRGGDAADAERLRRFAGEGDETHAAVLAVLSDPARSEALTFQQMTGPVTAKAVEDTSFYRWHRWSMLNEVGGDPALFGRTATAFHDRMVERARIEPLALSATATHDTKRGEDVRMRLAAATHRPDEWAGWARDWFEASTDLRSGLADNTCYLIFQTLVGFWPVNGEDGEADLADRLAEYVLKAARERKRDTSWTDQDEAYERALERLARKACEGELAGHARRAATTLAEPAADLSVARTVLKAAIPGVPDTYQGRELTDLSLVDPDNRRPVDWHALQKRQRDTGDDPSGRKFAATRAMLTLRRERPALFDEGAYVPIGAPDGTLAFERRHGDEVLRVALAVRPGASLPPQAGEVVFSDPAAIVTLT